jgi:putative flippase GtrA
LLQKFLFNRDFRWHRHGLAQPKMNSPSGQPRKIPKVLLRRIFWFLCGGVVGFGLNAGPFALLHRHLPDNAAYAASLAVATVVFFFWNYFVNFRTPAAWHACAWRYLAAVGVMYLLNFLLTTRVGFAMFPKQKYGVIAVVPALLSSVKFVLYNFWAFPHKPKAGV